MVEADKVEPDDGPLWTLSPLVEIWDLIFDTSLFEEFVALMKHLNEIQISGFTEATRGRKVEKLVFGRMEMQMLKNINKDEVL